MTSQKSWVAGLGAACAMVAATACGSVEDDGGDLPDAGPQFTIGGTVTGFAGDALVIAKDGGTPFTITADGAFTLPGGVADGATYDVAVVSDPACPLRRCTVASGSGTVAGADVTDVAITCAEPPYRLSSVSWGDDTVRFTDDLLALADGATAQPRKVAGASTGLINSTIDAIAVDVDRDLAYVANSTNLLVFADVATIDGNVAPAQVVTLPDSEQAYSLELDAAHDRLYVSGENRLFVFDDASAITGAATPSATLALATQPGAMSYDARTDRLFVGSNYADAYYVFDAAAAITSATTPTRTVTWDNTTGFQGPSTLAIDACRDRLYVGSNATSPGGFNLFAIDAASTVDGVVDLEADAAASINVGQCISTFVDGGGRLYCWPDSPSSVQIYDAPEAFSGVVTPTADREILGVVASGYGLDVQPY